MKISVIGCGYLGAVHATGMAALGHEVVALDIDERRIAVLASGEVPFYEPGLVSLLADAVASGRLRFTTGWSELAGCDVHFLCVGTPPTPNGAADLSQVWASVDQLARQLRGAAVVVGKSTVPVGTARVAAARLARNSPAGAAARLVWNPEFLREGHAVADTLQPDRIVVGVERAGDEVALQSAYEGLMTAGTPWITTDFETAELVKVAANAFLATKISFINAMALMSERVGADVTVLADALGYDARIGPQFLRAGVGFGGGCLPKDLKALHVRADQLGLADHFQLFENVEQINLAMRMHVVEVTEQLVTDIPHPRIGVLGAAFKPDSDDVRDSPALHVARLLQSRGAGVRVYDPQALETAAKLAPELDYAVSTEDVVKGANVLVLATEWQEFRDLDPDELAAVVANRRIVDARNVLDHAQWRNAGWTVRGIGRP